MPQYQQNKSLYIFDKDGTLIKNVGLRGFKLRNPLKPEDQVLKPGVFEKIAELRSQGHVIAKMDSLPGALGGLPLNQGMAREKA